MSPDEKRAQQGVPEEEPRTSPDEQPDDVTEKAGSDAVSRQHDDELVDEWGEESFPGSDPPAHY